ncbi:MAG: aminotransferase class I/II-fold pyridoxal phosphate-dependent enzyme [Acidimicrobiia bacterium]
MRRSLKWTQHGPEVLPAWVAEMDFGIAAPVAAALHEAVDDAATGYPSPAAEAAVAAAASAFWEQRFGWSVDPGRVAHAPDVVEGLRRAVVHLTEPETPVVVPTPAYYPFFSMVERAGRTMVGVSSRRDDDGRWRLDIDAIAAALRDGAGSVVLCNPWNPTGRCLDTEEVAAVIDVARAHGARVLADEVHAALIYPGSTHGVAAALDPETVVTVTAASKAFDIPGLKAAQVVLTNSRDLEVWSGYFTPDKAGVGTFGLVASAAAYSDGGPWLNEVLGRLDGLRHRLVSLVEEHLPRALCPLPEATYLAWIDLSAYLSESPAAHLLEHARVALTEGAQFGPGGEGHVRFNFATDDEVLVEIVARMASVLEAR